MSVGLINCSLYSLDLGVLSLNLLSSTTILSRLKSPLLSQKSQVFHAYARYCQIRGNWYEL